MQHIIEIRHHAFEPASMEISAGDTVVWHNQDNVGHSSVRDDAPAWDTGNITHNSTSAPVAFPDASPAEGWGYFCIPHTDMVGTIIVKPQAIS